MAPDYHRILFLFVDGVGLGEPGPDNPLAREPTPVLRRLLGGPLTLEQCQERDDLVLVPLDATLGVPGLPQSATGQASLFTGRNGAALLGRHQTGLPGPRTRRLVETHGFLARAVEAGLEVTFANAYSEEYVAAVDRGERRPSVTTVAARAAGLALRGLEDLARGEAVTWDLCRDLAARRAGTPLEPIAASQAGRHLARLADRHRLTVFETFLTDLAGHLKRGVEPAEAVRRLDRALGGIEAAKSAALTWVLTSDHGNLEELSHGSHTRNPVPLLAVGPAARRFAGPRSILDVAPAVLAALGAGR